MQGAPRHWTKFQRVASSNLPDRVKALRTRNLQKEREYWDAVALCYLMSEVSGLKMSMCRERDSDFDTIFTRAAKGSQAFAPVQLKELVPDDLNPSATLEEIFSKLNKYTNSNDLIVGIKLNRNIRIDFDSLWMPDLPIAEVWMFGATMPHEEKWSLFGNKYGKWHKWDIALPDA